MAKEICSICSKPVWFMTRVKHPDGVITHYVCWSEYRDKNPDLIYEWNQDEDTNQSPIKEVSYKEFADDYLVKLKGILDGFGNFFAFIGILFVIQAAVAIVVVAYLVVKVKTELGYLNAVGVVIYIVLVTWLAILCKSFVKLQTEKVEQDIRSTIEFREESGRVAEEILKKAEKKARDNINVYGGNAVFAINGSTVSGVNQSITIEGGEELVNSLALLVSFCEESKNAKALEIATKLSEEATKESPNKGVLFDLWSTITGIIPEVASIVKIAEGIKGLFV